MLKKDLRKIYGAKRAALDPVQREKWQDMMLIQFQRLPIDIPGIIFSYAAIENEFDPQIILDYCLFKRPDQQWAMPVIHTTDHSMKSMRVEEDTQFTLNQYGIPEPAAQDEILPKELEAVFVPLLAFDERGFRVGYGKGYYDRFLQQCGEHTLKIGFSFFESCEYIDDTHPFDIRLNYCVTPEKNYIFTHQNQHSVA